MQHELVSRFTFRAMTTEDIAGGMRLCRESGWNQMEEDWRVFLDSPDGGGFLAEKEGRIVGTSAFLRYGGLAWIAMMLVDPAERGAGLGGRLLQDVLDRLKDVPCVGLDATPLGERLYRHFDFVNDLTLVRMKTTLDAARFAVRPGVRKMRAADLSRVMERDREVFGADRARLLGSLLERAPECAWVTENGAAENGGMVSGYAFGRRGRLYHQVGPIVALERGTAQALAEGCFSQLDGRLCAIDVPRLDSEWLAWLGSAGFVEERPFVRMFRRGHRHPGDPTRQYAITGPEFA